MSHEVESAAYAVTPAWHQVGTVLPEAVRSAEMIRAAGLDWNVDQLPLVAHVERQVADVGPNGVDLKPESVTVDSGAFLNVRADTLAPLGVVSKRYKVFQNREAFAFMDTLVGIKGGVRYEAAGSLSGGKRIWLLARLTDHNGEEVIPGKGDRIIPYLCLVNSHDGTGSLRVGGTFVRVVCANTVAAFERDGNSKYELRQLEGSIRHTGDLEAKVETVRHAIGLITDGHRAYIDKARKLAAVQVDPASDEGGKIVNDWLSKLFPMPDDSATDRQRNNVREIWQTILTNFATSKSIAEVEGSAGTAWGLYNALTQYTDHQRKVRSADDGMRTAKRFDDAMWGDAASQKVDALEYLTEFVGAT